MYETRGTTGSSTRRAVLASLGTASALSLAGCVGGSGDDGEDELDEGGILVGVSVPDDDGRTREAQRLRDGYELAVEHLNSATGAITQAPWDNLSAGSDVLGGEIELVVEDTGGTGTGARTSAQTLVEAGVDVLTGGVSREEGLAIQDVATEEEVVYMGGFVPTDEVGGEQCSRYAFHEMYNVEIAVESLARQLVDEIGPGSSATFAQLYPETAVGEAFSRAFESRLGAEGWFQPRRVGTPEGRSYEGEIRTELDAGRDLLVLNYYGLDGLTALRDFESAVDPDDDVVVAVPILGPRMTESGGSALEDVFGTVHWLPGLGGSFSNAFEDSWDGSTDAPTQFAHLAYVQLCQYVAAAVRAGSLDSADVIDELEGYEYDTGTGRHRLRECDHQAMRYAPVVQGRNEVLQQSGRYYELVASVEDGADNPPYGCDGGPAWSCSL